MSYQIFILKNYRVDIVTRTMCQVRSDLAMILNLPFIQLNLPTYGTKRLDVKLKSGKTLRM